MSLVHNAALLLMIVYLYDLASKHWRWQRLTRIPVGIGLGLIGIILMLTPLHMAEGVFYDTRSILLSLAGLFFGPIATLVAVLITGAFRFYLGGAGAWTGIAVIVLSASCGLLWRHYRNRLGEQVRVRELYLFGAVVAFLMLMVQFTLPDGQALRVLSGIALPMMLVYPLTTVLIGWLILDRLMREQKAEALSSSEQQLLAMYQHAPVPLWKEDYSAVRIEVEHIRKSAGADLEGYFRSHPGEVWRLASLVKVVGANEAVLELAGVSLREELHGTLESFFNEESMLSFTQRLLCLVRGETTYQGHSTFVRRNGEVRRVSIQLFVMPGHEDSLAQVIVSSIDITERERYNREVRESYQLLARLTDQVPGLIYKYQQFADGRACFPYASQGMEELYGLKPSEVREDATPVFTLIHPDDLPQVQQSIESSRLSLMPWECEYRITHPRNGERWLQGFARPQRTEDEGTLWYGYIKDVTERKRLEARVELASRVFEAAGEAILVTDAQAHIVATNPAFEAVTGYKEAEVLGKNPRILSSGRQDRDFYRKMWAVILEKGQWSGEVMNRRKNGEVYPEWLTLSSVRDAHGTVRYYVSVFSDLTEIRGAQMLAERRALEDSLTGLSNRSALIRHIDREIGRVRGRGQYSALLMLDLDEFKLLNEVHGLVAGDRMLKKVAATLSSLVGADSMVARFGADEFALTLPFEVKSRDEAGRLALELSESLRAALRALEDDAYPGLRLDCSTGIAVFPDVQQDRAADVLQQGDWALHQAKQSRQEGGPRAVFFQAAMGQQIRERYRLEQELREAVDGDQLRLYLQPQFDVNGRHVSAEALIRWQHPERGLVPPGMFIPLAESSGLIFDLERWMLREVCRLLAQLDARGNGLGIALNISAKHFEQEGFVDDVLQALALSGADPGHLVLEVTESIIIDNMAGVTSKMLELTKLGIRFSLDDFGTGYSSLSYLKRLPIHELKIDRSFIMDAPTTPSDAALVEIIVAVASTLKLQVVAEGVETQEQADFLKQHPAVILQGYLYDKPLPLADWLNKYMGGVS